MLDWLYAKRRRQSVKKRFSCSLLSAFFVVGLIGVTSSAAFGQAFNVGGGYTYAPNGGSFYQTTINYDPGNSERYFFKLSYWDTAGKLQTRYDACPNGGHYPFSCRTYLPGSTGFYQQAVYVTQPSQFGVVNEQYVIEQTFVNVNTGSSSLLRTVCPNVSACSPASLYPSEQEVSSTAYWAAVGTPFLIGGQLNPGGGYGGYGPEPIAPPPYVNNYCAWSVSYNCLTVRIFGPGGWQGSAQGTVNQNQDSLNFSADMFLSGLGNCGYYAVINGIASPLSFTLGGATFSSNNGGASGVWSGNGGCLGWQSGTWTR